MINTVGIGLTEDNEIEVVVSCDRININKLLITQMEKESSLSIAIKGNCRLPRGHNDHKRDQSHSKKTSYQIPQTRADGMRGEVGVGG